MSLTRKTASTSKQLQVIYEGQDNPISARFTDLVPMQQQQAKATQMTNSVIKLFAIYTTAQVRSDEKMTNEERAIVAALKSELAQIIIDEFAHLSFPEIGQAFKMAYAGKFGDLNLSAYYGQISVELLTKILVPYCSWRQTTLFEIRQAERLRIEQEAAQEREKIIKDKRIEADKKALKIATDALKKLQESLISGVDLPSPEVLETKITFLGRMVRPLIDAGVIKISKEQLWKFYEEARPLALKEMNVHAGGDHQLMAHLSSMAKLQEDTIDGGTTKELERVQKRIARGLVIRSVLPNLDSVRANWNRKKLRATSKQIKILYIEIERLQEEIKPFKRFLRNKGLSRQAKEDCANAIRDKNRHISSKRLRIESSLELMTEEERLKIEIPIEVTKRENGTPIVKIINQAQA